MVVAAVVWKGSTKNGFSCDVVSVAALVVSSVVLEVSSVVLVAVVVVVVVVVREVVVRDVVVGDVVEEVVRDTLASGYTWGPPVGSTELSAVFSTA